MNRTLRRSRSCGVLALALLASCDAIQELTERSRGATPHEDYVESLRAAGLLDAAAGRDWIDAAARAVRAPLAAAVPVEETGYLDPLQPAAVALRVTLQRGQRIVIEAALEPDTLAQVFIDVFHVATDTMQPPRHVAAADSAGRRLVLEPARSGDYVVRVQPELLRGGRYTLRIHSGPSLAFPVDGVADRAIGSRFGAPRDDGAREHHGIDIFAPRGTPVIAATEATVSRVRETPLGGRVVWLRDERRNQSIYYAHLDTQLVAAGTRVRAGDTIGTVGNTGNARTTPPHLHFGVYRHGEGAVDPYPFVHRPARTAAPLRADTALFGDWARTDRPTTLRPAAAGAEDLPTHTALRVRGGSGSMYRVELPDGREGWIDAGSVTPTASPVVSRVAAADCALYDRPLDGAALVREIAAGETLPVLAEYGDFALVRTARASGWAACG